MKRLFSLVTLCLFVAFEASATVYVCSQEIKNGNSYTSLSGGTIKSTTSGKTAKVSRRAIKKPESSMLLFISAAFHMVAPDCERA